MSKHETLAAALAAAQRNMVNPSKDLRNGHLGNRYTSLAGLRDAVIPALAAEGVSLIQSVDAGQDDGQGIVTVSTAMLWGGERVECGRATVLVSPTKGITYIQALGSAVTYLRRYQMGAAVGVASDHDDDGNAGGSGQRSQPLRQQQHPHRQRPKLSFVSEELRQIREDVTARLKVYPFGLTDVLAYLSGSPATKAQAAKEWASEARMGKVLDVLDDEDSVRILVETVEANKHNEER